MARPARRRWLHELAALVATFVVALIVSASMTHWLPAGAAQIDHVLFAVVGFPLVWATLTLGVLGAERRRRAWLLTLALGGLALLPVIGGFLG